MWKKDEESPTQSSVDSRAPSASASTSRSTSPGGGRATIGPSISIKGDVTGSEDLLIQGQIDGSVTLDKHAVGVGSEGRVKANIVGRLITIEGRVEGDLTAEEQIILRGSAEVHGDIKAPRVVLEDGATFRGLVDMGTSTRTTRADTASTSTSKDAASDKPSSGRASGTAPSQPTGSSSKDTKDAATGTSRASA